MDHLTYGRVMLGCGPGVLGPDIKLFDLDPSELRPMMNESLDIILKLYREEGLVWYEGNYWQINGMEVQIKPYQQPHLPVYLTSSGSGNSVRVAAERGLPLRSAVFTLPGAMPLSEQWDTYERIATEAGHRVSRDDWSVGNIAVYVAESDEQAYEDVAAGAMQEIREYPLKAGGKSTYEAYPGQPEDEITFAQIVERRNWIIGDPDHCVQRISDLQEASGGFGTLLILTLEWTSTEKWYRSLELFSRYVIPQFNGSLRGLDRSFRRMVKGRPRGKYACCPVRADHRREGAISSSYKPLLGGVACVCSVNPRYGMPALTVPYLKRSSTPRRTRQAGPGPASGPSHRAARRRCPRRGSHRRHIFHRR